MYSKKPQSHKPISSEMFPETKNRVDPCYHLNQGLGVPTLWYLRATVQKRQIYRSLIIPTMLHAGILEGPRPWEDPGNRFQQRSPTVGLPWSKNSSTPLRGRWPLWISKEWLGRYMQGSETGGSQPTTAGPPARPTRPPWSSVEWQPLSPYNPHKSNMALQGNKGIVLASQLWIHREFSCLQENLPLAYKRFLQRKQKQLPRSLWGI